MRLYCACAIFVWLTACSTSSNRSEPLDAEPPDVSTDAGTPDVGADAELIDTPTALYRAEGGHILTADDHVLLLRGVNVSGVAKNTSDYLFPLTQEDVDVLRQGGMNSVRLLTFWCAVSPDGPGETNADYLEAFAARAQMLTDAGMYVIIDMHQDLWGQPFANHGAPEWACPAELAEGYQAASPWYANYGSDQVTACFDNFWGDPALRAAMVDAWVAVAEAVCPLEGVVGFDHINEPWSGSELLNPDFDNDVLMPFYREVMAGIDAVCPGRLHFLERGGGGVLGLADVLQIPDDVRQQVVYAPHFYPQEVHDPSPTGYSMTKEALEARLLDEFGTHLSAGVPVWIGEFGGMTSNPNFDVYIQDLHEIFLEHGIMSALWDYVVDSGGFGYLEAPGQPKPVFDTVYRLPGFTLLPSAPEALGADWDAREVMARFVCEPGKRVEVLLPNDGCTCATNPVEMVTPPTPVVGMAIATCQSTGVVEMTCGCAQPASR